jgi:hypothetical protein
VSKRRRRPQLRVIAGGGSKAGIAGRDAPAGQVVETLWSAADVAAAPPRREPTPETPSPAIAPDEEFSRRYYEGQHEKRRIAADVDRLRYAIVDLAAIELPALRLLEELSPTFDRPIIRDRLIRAIDCLSQFAEEWRLEELIKAGR